MGPRMKFTLLLTLLVATAAQDGEGSQGSDSQGAQGSQGAQAAQGGGYGEQAEAAPQESYGGEQQSYGEQPEAYAHEEHYSQHYSAVVAKCCVSVCPLEAPFFHPHTCACVPGHIEEEHHEEYAQPQESYGGEAQQSYGGEAQQSSGYRKLQEGSAPEFTSGPRGTIDTRLMNIQRTGSIVLWVCFAIFFITSCYYLKMFQWYYAIADAADGTVDGQLTPINSAIFHFLATPTLVAGVVCLIASLAYLTMATGNGWYTRCCDGRMFFYARYIDWVVTTPLMLHALCHFSNAPDEMWNFMFFTDIIMIISGCIASTICGGEKWIFFGFSIIAFIPVLYYICWLRDTILNANFYDPITGLMITGQKLNGQVLPYLWFYHTYHIIADLTVVAWFMYPVVWIFAEGANKLSVTGEAIVYAVLDLISKAVFGWIITNTQLQNNLIPTSAPGMPNPFNPGNPNP